MIERRVVDLADTAGRIVHLSAPDDARWSGLVVLAPRADFALGAGARHDALVLRGDVVDEAGRVLSTGDFARRAAAGRWRAGTHGATLLAYREAAGEAREHVVARDDRAWRRGRADGLDVAPLDDDGHALSLVRWRPGARTAPHAHARGEEIFVIDGELRSGDDRHPAGTWLRLHPGAPHAPCAEVPALILLRNGHLPRAPR